MVRKERLAAALALLVLGGCGGGGGGGGLAAGESAPRIPVTQSRDGGSYRQEIPAAGTGDSVVFQVFEPTRLEAGKTYPLVLHGTDPRHRLRVLAPDITWHDLPYSLNAHDVIKSGYALALSAGGESGSQAQTDTVIRETLVQGAATNVFPEPGINFFRYHSFRYFCDGEHAGEQNFMVPGAQPDPREVLPLPPPAADVLLTQGFRDTLFNFNDALANYECLQRFSGDVRLLTHQSGHILPASLSALPGAEDGLDPFFAALTAPNFQDAGGSRSCGSLNLDDVQFAWFEEKLRGPVGLKRSQGARRAPLTRRGRARPRGPAR